MSKEEQQAMKTYFNKFHLRFYEKRLWNTLLAEFPSIFLDKSGRSKETLLAG